MKVGVSTLLISYVLQSIIGHQHQSTKNREGNLQAEYRNSIYIQLDD